MEEKLESARSLIISYLTLRKAIGILGTSFPFLLYFGALIFYRTGIQSSISSYYHTGMRDVFVGVLCVIGFFLLSYRGHNTWDEVVGDFACVFAIGVALFPTAPDGPVSCDVRLIGYFHLAFAASFFVTLIIFSLCLFTKTHLDREPTTRKRHRNKIYRACGYIMSVCVLLMVIYTLLPDKVGSPVKAWNPIFWLEAFAVVTFGISWLIKGETIFKDKDEFLEQT